MSDYVMVKYRDCGFVANRKAPVARRLLQKGRVDIIEKTEVRVIVSPEDLNTDKGRINKEASSTGSQAEEFPKPGLKREPEKTEDGWSPGEEDIQGLEKLMKDFPGVETPDKAGEQAPEDESAETQEEDPGEPVEDELKELPGRAMIDEPAPEAEEPEEDKNPVRDTPPASQTPADRNKKKSRNKKRQR